jgi:DNA-binding transcriptional LysR family regulator
VLNLVAAGFGVAIVPASCASAAGPQVVMRQIMQPARSGALVLVCRKGDRNPAMALLTSLMTDTFKRLQALVNAKLGGK